MMRRQQRGVSLSGFLLWSVVLIFVALLGFKIGPPYMEFMTIQKQLQAIGRDPAASSGQRRDVEEAFLKRSMVENITSISAKDLTISKEGDGIVVSAEYSTCVPVVYNLRACMDFTPSSKK
jgi:hypothetical protein